MRPLSQRLQLLRGRLSDTGRLAVSDASVIQAAIDLAKRYEEAPVRDFFVGRRGYQVDSDAHGHCYELKHLDGQRVRIVLDKEG